MMWETEAPALTLAEKIETMVCGYEWRRVRDGKFGTVRCGPVASSWFRSMASPIY